MPDHALVALALAHERLAEDLRVLGRRGLGALRLLRGRRGHALGDRVRLGGVPLLHALEAAVLGRGEALALDGRDVHDDGPLGLEGAPQRAAQGVDVVAVDDAHVGPVELLPPQAGRGEGLDRLLELRAEALEGGADAGGQLRQLLLHPLARSPQPRLQAHAVEVARERPDVGRDRHAVVVEHDHHRRAEAARLVDRLERDAAGHGAVADHRGDLAVVADAVAHRLLEPDRVADRGRGVARAHDVVLGLEDRAERREAGVLADRRDLVAAAGEDLVRVGLVADVPEDLVARRVQQRVQRDGDLAGAEVGAEVPADLPHRVDQQLADLLGDLLELVVGEPVEVGGAVDAVEDAGHEGRVKMKSVMRSSSSAPPGAAWASALRALRCDSAAISRAPSSPYWVT